MAGPTASIGAGSHLPQTYDCRVNAGDLAALLRRQAMRYSVAGAAIGVLSEGIDRRRGYTADAVQRWVFDQWDGGLSGERSALRIVPEHRAAVILMTNGSVLAYASLGTGPRRQASTHDPLVSMLHPRSPGGCGG